VKELQLFFQPLLKTLNRLKQPIDRVAISLICFLTILMGLLLLTGDTTSPKVREFSWQNKEISAEDTGFLLTFNRPMDHKSVEDNLRVDPPLPGKFSWAGRRMAYTLMAPAPYGITYGLQLKDAQDKFYGEKTNSKGGVIEPFNGVFRSRDRAFVYIGVKGEEEGRLILVNLSSKEPKPIALTPKDLVVMDFKPYPKGDRVLFSASDRALMSTGTLQQEIFTVTTGLNPQSPGEESTPNQVAGKLEKVLSSGDYQNLKFDLSSNGKIIVIQRVNKEKPADFGPWIIEEGEFPRRLENTEQGGDFMIRPDHKSMVISQKQGLSIIPFNPKEGEVVFLPKFAQVLGFARDNSAAVYVKYNTDYTRSLFLVNNQGLEQEMLRIPGSIISVQFDPRDTEGVKNTRLYCLLTQRLDTEKYQEQPFIALLDLAKKTLTPLLVLPNNQPDIHLSLSPDGFALLFDQTITNKNGGEMDQPRGEGGNAIGNSRLWLLPLVDTSDDGKKSELKPEELPFAGFHPRWLP
jgi:hypothetical protein